MVGQTELSFWSNVEVKSFWWVSLSLHFKHTQPGEEKLKASWTEPSTLSSVLKLYKITYNANENQCLSLFWLLVETDPAL